MGCGKSTLGKLAADQLALPFRDLDHEIERRTKQTISTLFEQHGEPVFRDHEHRILGDLIKESAGQPYIIALGGGTFAQSRNRPHIPTNRLIFLEVPLHLLEERLAACTHRPLAQDVEKVRKLYADRLPHYSQAATTLAIAPEDDLSTAANKLAMLLRGLL
jgi:shikimate kinase